MVGHIFVKPFHNIGEETITTRKSEKKGNFQMQNRVFVLDNQEQPLMPCHPARARELLAKNKAAIFRRFPFTIILKQREGGQTQPARAKFKAMGRGKRQVRLMDKYGFPRKTKTKKKKKRVKGFQTGDIVEAVVKKGTKKGSYKGRIAVRSSGSFDIKTGSQTVEGIGHRWCKRIQRQDGYLYSLGVSSPSKSATL